ncbi:equilibrative nucleoside transporter 1 isoform X1 [Lingula anatina]|uniref:Equilibrative nucleoside transporter 1 isoform X1 n=1 Tax=Lingula anatina TaxID=7574 RepID=A0A1S3HS97_LINAN|nr:equilibrative nucleoside transporter 1-like isoform X1 [Lingula anatina]XP_013409871.1 equilibrative nucleoside transporter 1 isoform X1 [Lingula anatina]|eukprot:XP_013388910.1 equilibrative nucleoside transporter 1-like isoform X1 [Lingula anatina]
MDSESTNDEEPLISRDDPPKDRFNAVYCIFYIIGIATLLPWNFFITAKQYFDYKLRNLTFTSLNDWENPLDETSMQIQFENYVSICAMVPNILFMFLNAALTKVISAKVRLVCSFTVMIIMFIVTIVLVKIDTDTWQTEFFIATLASVVFLNMGSSVLQGASLGLASLFPEGYTQAVMGGMAMGGTFAAVANVISIAAGSSATQSAFYYFMLAAIVLIIALIAYLSLPLLKFARYYLEIKDYPLKETVESIEPQPNGDVMPINYDGPEENDESLESINGSQPIVDHTVHQKTHFRIILKRVWVLGTSVLLVFFVTLSVFPAIISHTESVAGPSESLSLNGKYFTPVVCFVLFNLGDLTGRTVAGWVQYPKEKSVLLPILTVLRIGFIPLFLLCNFQPRKHGVPVVFDSDVYPVVFILIFAVSNGYLGTLCMIYGPKHVPAGDMEAAGAIMSVFLTVGLGLGSLFSFALIKLV